MTHHYSLLIAAPIYNEEKYLKLALHQLMDEQIPDCVDKVAYLLIDDGSTDQSPEIYMEFASAYPNVSYFRHSNQQGYGQTILDAMALAISQGRDLLVTYDSDLQHDVRTICNMVQRYIALDGKVPIISSSRYLSEEFLKDGNVPNLPKDRYLINMFVTELLNTLTGFHLTDSFCGMKLYHVPSLQNLPMEVFSRGYDFPLELLMWWAKSNLTITEVPTPSIYQEGRRLRDDWAERFQSYSQVLEKSAWTDEQKSAIEEYSLWVTKMLNKFMGGLPEFSIVPFKAFKDLLRDISSGNFDPNFKNKMLQGNENSAID